MKSFAAILFAIAALVATPVFASNGTGSESFCERHGCVSPTECPVPDPCPTLTCPPVTCEPCNPTDGDGDDTITVINVSPVVCEAPNYVRCKRVPVSEKYPKGLRCPGKRVQKRVFVPEPATK